MQSDATELRTIQGRLDRLEGQNRMLRRMLASLALLAGSAATLAFTLPQDRTVRAERLVLVDEAGRERGAMAVEDGHVAIRVTTPQQAPVSGPGGGTVQAVPAPTTLRISPEGSLVLSQGGQELFRLGKPSLRFVR